jgi:hypothetical protein
MEHVGERLEVHETMLDGYMEELRKRSLAVLGCFQCSRQFVIERRAHSLVIAKDLFALGPVAGLIVGELAVYRIDTKGKEVVKARRKRLQPAEFAPEEIPVESLQMAQVEDNPMSFSDGAFVKGLGTHDLE